MKRIFYSLIILLLVASITVIIVFNYTSRKQEELDTKDLNELIDLTSENESEWEYHFMNQAGHQVIISYFANELIFTEYGNDNDILKQTKHGIDSFIEAFIEDKIFDVVEYQNNYTIVSPYFILTLDQNGELIAKEEHENRAKKVIENKEEVFYLMKYTDTQPVLETYARNGSLIETNQMSSSLKNYQEFILLNDGNIIGVSQQKLTKFDQSGSLIWEKHIGLIEDVILSVDGNIILIKSDTVFYSIKNYFSSRNTGYKTSKILKLDQSNGQQIWSNAYGNRFYTVNLETLYEDSNQYVYAVGSIKNHNQNYPQYNVNLNHDAIILAKISSNGNKSGENIYNLQEKDSEFYYLNYPYGIKYDVLHPIIKDQTASILVSHYVRDNDQDYLITDSILDMEQTLPESSTLFIHLQNYAYIYLRIVPFICLYLTIQYLNNRREKRRIKDNSNLNL